MTEHSFYMERAIQLAKRGTGFTNPNPLVGAVIVKDHRIIGEGWHARYGDLHAERNALKHCTEDPAGATMYVTLEPCCHHGKQPPCTEALVESGQKVAPKVGNAMPLKNVPLGTSVHNIEIRPGSGGKVARAAGQQAIVSNREAGYALIKMPSGEIRRFNEDCYCTIGQVGNTQHMNEMSGKAGRTRWMGVRPTVRGMTMNPVDHPNGGGEGKSKSGGGRQHLKSPWGHVKGQKTRRLRKPSDSVIVQRRNAK